VPRAVGGIESGNFGAAEFLGDALHLAIDDIHHFGPACSCAWVMDEPVS
jgi:hypothetical protein